MHGTATVQSTSAPPAAPQPAVATRLQWVDQAKGVGIVLVVFGHVIDGVHNAGIRIDALTFRLTWDTLYSFHIPLFFFLSGLFFPHSWQQRGLRGVMLNKVDTLVYPYLLWSLLQGFTQVALSQHVNNPVTAAEVLSLLWHPRQEFWFLYALFFTYLIACVSYYFVPPPGIPSLAARSPARQRWMLLLGAAVLYFLRTNIPHVAAIWYPAWYLLYFLAGALLHRAARWVTELPALSLPLAVLVFGGAIVALHLLSGQLAGGQSSPVISAGNIIAAFAGTAMTIAVSALLARHGFKFVAYLGRMSLQVYLLHTAAAGCTRIVLQKVLGVSNLEVHLVLGTAVGVGAPLAFAYLVQRWNIPGLFSLPPKLQLERRRARAAPAGAG